MASRMTVVHAFIASELPRFCTRAIGLGELSRNNFWNNRELDGTVRTEHAQFKCACHVRTARARDFGA